MDDRSIRLRWTVLRLGESSRLQRQVLAQAYQQIFPQARRPLGGGSGASCHRPSLHFVNLVRHAVRAIRKYLLLRPCPGSGILSGS